MDLIEGIPIAHNMENSLSDFVDLQLKMHKIDLFTLSDACLFLPNIHNFCRSVIEITNDFSPSIKSKLINLLNYLPVENILCHNDYHGFNVIKNHRGLHIIDWTSAMCGRPEADCCATYMTTTFFNKEYSDVYLKTYCERSDICSDDILRWLPIHAAAWRYRNPGVENPQVAEWLSMI